MWFKQINGADTKKLRIKIGSSYGIFTMQNGYLHLERPESIVYISSDKFMKHYGIMLEKISDDKAPKIEPMKRIIDVEQIKPILNDSIVPEKIIPISNNYHPFFSISILCLNRLEYTKKCLESIFCSQNDCTFELIVTDNGSTDETKQYIESLIDNRIIKVYHNTNLGFIGGHKYALNLAKNNLFLMLNNDVVVFDYWLDKIYKGFNDEYVKAVGVHGGLINKGGFGIRTLNKNHYDYLEGSCLALPTNFIKLFGLFDKDLINSYYEDVDLCLRLKKVGYKLNLVDAKILHRNINLTIDVIDRGRELAEINRNTFMRKWSNYLKTRNFDSIAI